MDDLQRRVAELEAREAEHERTERVQTALFRIAEATSEARDLQEFYRAVHATVGELLSAENFYIALYDDERKAINFPYTVDALDPDIPDPNAWDPIGVGWGRGLTAYVLRTGRPALISAERHRVLVAAGEIETLGLMADGDWLGAPLTANGRAIGVVVCQTYGADEHYNQEDLELLAFVGQHIGSALSRARAMEETRQRSAELSLVNEIGQALAEQLEFGAIIELVGERVRKLFEASSLFIALYDAATNLISWPYDIDEGERFHREPRELGPGLTSRVITTQRPVRVGSMAEQEAAGAIQIGGTETLSWLGVPIVGANRVVGVVGLESIHAHAFSEGDERLLATLAASMGVALENARLIDETRQRVAELAIVNEVGNALASQLDLDNLIELVGDEMRRTFEADIVYVAFHDVEAGRIEFPYASEFGEQTGQDPLPFGENLTSRILQTRETLILNKAADWEAIGTRGVGTVAKSYLGVPILVGETAIGVISVQSTTTEGRFGESDARLLSTLAASVGAAIQNARLVRAQQESEEHFRRLVEQLPLSIYTDKPDSTSTSTYVSPKTVEMFGYPIEAWMQEGFFDSIVHPDDRNRIVDEIDTKVAGSDQTASHQYRIVAADGHVVWVRDDSWIVRDADGTPLHIQGFMIDITEGTLAAAEIRRQKQYFESLVEISPVAVVTMDRDEIVSGWNPAARQLFGYEPDEALSRHINDLLFAPDERAEGAATTRLADETGRAHLIGQRRRKDGQLVDVEIVLVPLVVDGEHTGYYAIYHDITELQAARREADAANAAKSTFLAAMSHEIRTPMNAIIGMSGLMLDTPLTDEQRDYAETIRTSGDALLTIINDILDFSKIEAGKVELERHPFALAPCIEGALDVLASAAAAKNLELVYAIDDGLPRAIVGDEGRLRQIVLNLLSNAIKFTDRGEVELTVSGRPVGSAAPAHRWRFSIDVRDTGIGIPADRIDRLFVSFSQADASISRRYGGTGLGLAISRRLAELMDGSLTAESAGVAGSGSILHLIVEADASETAVAPPLVGADLAGRTVLVVDDNATNRRILTRLLERWGMASQATGSPREALGWVADGRHFDIAIVDLHMPELDGISLATALHASDAGAATPVVILSSLGARERESDGVATFLVKPVKPSSLHDALATVLAGRSTSVPVRSAGMAIDRELGARHPLRILLAEDNPVNQKLARRLLEQMGYHADVAGNGQEAISAIEGSVYDIVLMDVQMPELDGLEATRRIRRRWPGAAGPRIVAMTANAMEGDREACLEAGMDDYISKPIRPEVLSAVLAETTSRSGPATAEVRV